MGDFGERVSGPWAAGPPSYLDPPEGGGGVAGGGVGVVMKNAMVNAEHLEHFEAPMTVIVNPSIQLFSERLVYLTTDIGEESERQG